MRIDGREMLVSIVGDAGILLESSSSTVARAIPMIRLTVNGEPRRFEAPLTAAQLIASLQLGGKRVALERNGEIVPRGQFDQQQLADGDRLEIVVAVGGG